MYKGPNDKVFLLEHLISVVFFPLSFVLVLYLQKTLLLNASSVALPLIQ